MPTDTALIVINHNGKDHLRECLPTLLGQTFAPLKLYLLDNASTDGSKEFVSRNFPSVAILAMDKGCGFAGGFNRAIALVKEELIGLISNDTLLDSRWTEEMRSAMMADPRIAIAGCKVFFHDRPNILNSAGQRITPLGMGFEKGFGSTDATSFNIPGSTASVCGAAMMVRKSAFEHIGGFDEDYFLIGEELDLCWRAWIAGYSVFYQPAAFIFHKYGATIGKRETPLRTYRTQRNSIASVIKNRQGAWVIPTLAGCLAVACLRLAARLLRGDTRLLKAQLDGILGVLPMLPALLRKRRIINRLRRRSDSQLYALKLFASWVETIKEFIRLQKINAGTNQP